MVGAFLGLSFGLVLPRTPHALQARVQASSTSRAGCLMMQPAGDGGDLAELLASNREAIDRLSSATSTPQSDITLLRFAMGFPEHGAAATAINEAISWRAGNTASPTPVCLHGAYTWREQSEVRLGHPSIGSTRHGKLAD